MVTVIISRDYTDARLIASQLDLGHDWIYPHDHESLRGVTISRIVFVDGWVKNAQLTPELIQAMVARTTSLYDTDHVHLVRYHVADVEFVSLDPADVQRLLLDVPTRAPGWLRRLGRRLRRWMR